jgi:myo-inositol-1(or 4)-monophosphatase
LIEAARESGRIATQFTGPTAEVWDKPDGAGPVTEADLAVNRMLENDLRAACPDYGWLSEESVDDASRLNAERVFIIDPIDGTRSFIEGARTWAHALAVAQQGQVIAAVVYLPMLDKMYTAEIGGGAHLNGEPICASDTSDLAAAEILAARPTMNPANWPGGMPDVAHSHRPSLAYRLSLVAEGRFDAMLTLRPSWEWDIAAGDLLLREAGAISSTRTGTPLQFNNPVPQQNGVVAGNTAIHAELLARLQPVE